MRKMGIMSLLKAKVADIIKANPQSQILLMTHDIQCLYVLQKLEMRFAMNIRERATDKRKLHTLVVN